MAERAPLPNSETAAGQPSAAAATQGESEEQLELFPRAEPPARAEATAGAVPVLGAAHAEAPPGSLRGTEPAEAQEMDLLTDERPSAPVASSKLLPGPESGSGAERASFAPTSASHRAEGLGALCVAALGVVYGDIGTSPLYALRECFHGTHAVAVTEANVLGVLSLVFYSLIVVIWIKHLVYVMRMDDQGEGGILALMGLASAVGRRSVGLSLGLGLLGAGLLFGDGIITPAISVLSAVEGLEVVTSELAPHVVPITLVVLVGLFWFQRRGTARVGAVFGPIIMVWFVALGLLGVRGLVSCPTVLRALDPRHAWSFLMASKTTGFLVLGAVVLVVTGGEALYADMGHFGLRPIRLSWYGLVLPALVLNYLGQGALLLSDPSRASHPFYGLVPRWGLVPMVVLATLATVIASQAVISGVFSLTRQAVMLGFWPRLRIDHTSATLRGQIYVPSVNWALMVATLALVLSFRASTNLAAAYGIAVTATGTITTLLAFVVTLRRWHWPWWLCGLVSGGFLVIDLAFLGATAVKVLAGGWLPLAVAGVLYVLMTTWKRGRELLGQRVRASLVPLEDFWELMRIERPARVPGTAVFMTSNPAGTPLALLQNFTHNRVVHQHVILLTVSTSDTARVPEAERLSVTELEHGFVRVEARYGFMEHPNVPALVAALDLPGLSVEHTTYFLGREAVIANHDPRASWRHRLFSTMSRNAAGATDFFNLPPDRVLEIGTQIRL